MSAPEQTIRTKPSADTLRRVAQTLREQAETGVSVYGNETGYMADGWGIPEEEIDGFYADWLDEQADAIDADNGAGPRHRWFAWHPVMTDTGRKWLRMVTRQKRWDTYVHDPSMGTGGMLTYYEDWCWHYE